MIYLIFKSFIQLKHCSKQMFVLATDFFVSMQHNSVLKMVFSDTPLI